MKIIRPKAETKAVLSCLLSPSKVKTELLGRLSPEHFGYRPMHAAYRIIDSMMTKSALDLPSMETFLEHPDLEQDFRSAGFKHISTYSEDWLLGEEIGNIENPVRFFEDEQHDQRRD